MVRGTAPVLQLSIAGPWDLNTWENIFITFKQKRHGIEFDAEDFAVSENGKTVLVKLTQEETLSLYANEPVWVQIRVSNVDGTEADATLPAEMPVEAILKEGVI